MSNLLDNDDSLLLHFNLEEVEEHFLKETSNNQKQNVQTVTRNSQESVVSLRNCLSLIAQRQYNEVPTFKTPNPIHASKSTLVDITDKTFNAGTNLNYTAVSQSNQVLETFKKPNTILKKSKLSLRRTDTVSQNKKARKSLENVDQTRKDEDKYKNTSSIETASSTQNVVIDTSVEFSEFERDLFADDELPTDHRRKNAKKTLPSDSVKTPVNVDSDQTSSQISPSQCSFFKSQWTQNYELNLMNQHNETLLTELNNLQATLKTGENNRTLVEDCQNLNWSTDTFMISNSPKIQTGQNLFKTLANNAENAVNTSQNQLNISAALNTSFRQMGPFYDLPLKVKELIKSSKNISNLYEWQDQCLKLEAVKTRKNLIYALPTSGGKTLVAEILLLREILCRRKDVLFVLPFVSIVQEKVWALSPFQVALNFVVEEYAANKGQFPPRKRRTKRCAYIATIEKASTLVNCLIENDCLSDIGLIIVDEIHLIGEKNRGSILEMMLTKVLFAKENIQIIGMSATMGNLNELCTFLKADMYTRDFRPIELTEFVKCENEIAKVNTNGADGDEFFVPCRTLPPHVSKNSVNKDPDQISVLVEEVVDSGSCLIFCATKKNCENVAILLSEVLDKNLRQCFVKERNSIRLGLEMDGRLCPVLQRTIPCGIAYHHSGLTGEERTIIEDAFRAGVLNVICCTSTLAAGVNLPAQRVILRSPYVGRNFISLSKYKQMVGRAGRAGLGETGDSIVICLKKDLPKLRKILSAPMDQAVSDLHTNDDDGLKRLILSVIGLSIADTRHTIKELINHTLLQLQAERFELDISKVIDKVLVYLIKSGTIYPKLNKDGPNLETWNNSMEVLMMKSLKNNGSGPEPRTDVSNTIIISDTCELDVTSNGKATINGGFTVKRAQMLYEDLLKAQSSLVLLNSLHLLFLVTPYELVEQITIDPNVYCVAYGCLTEAELQTAKVIGISHYAISRIIIGQSIKNVPERIITRFYVTLMLYDLWKDATVFDVADKFRVNRGIVQQLMVSSAAFAASVNRYCEAIDQFKPFCSLLHDISIRLAYCCTPELVPFFDLPGVRKARAKQLYTAGYTSLETIAAADPMSLVRKIKNLNKHAATQIVSGAKMLLLNRVEYLREDADEILSKIN